MDPKPLSLVPAEPRQRLSCALKLLQLRRCAREPLQFGGCAHKPLQLEGCAPQTSKRYHFLIAVLASPARPPCQLQGEAINAPWLSLCINNHVAILACGVQELSAKAKLKKYELLSRCHEGHQIGHMYPSSHRHGSYTPRWSLALFFNPLNVRGCIVL